MDIKVISITSGALLYIILKIHSSHSSALVLSPEDAVFQKTPGVASGYLYTMIRV